MGSSEENVEVLHVAIADNYALIRVCGKGTFKDGPPLRRFGHAALDKGCDCIVVDLDECSGMDSTFMGVIAGFGIRMRREETEGRVIAMNLTPRTATPLETLGMDQIIDCFRAGVESESLNECLSGLGVSAIEVAEDGKKVTLETMLAAHQNLVQVDPENEAKFKDVITYLDQDLKEITGKNT